MEFYLGDPKVLYIKSLKDLNMRLIQLCGLLNSLLEPMAALFEVNKLCASRLKRIPVRG